MSSCVPTVVNQRELFRSLMLCFTSKIYTSNTSNYTSTITLHTYKWLTFKCIKTAYGQPTHFFAQICTIWFTHNLWCIHICCTVNSLIDVKVHQGSFELQQFAAADGRTSSLRFIRLVTFPFTKYFLISLYSFLPEIWNKNSWILFCS